MRREDSNLEISSLFFTKSFKIIHKNCNTFIISKLRNMELCIVFEDDPDFHKQNLENSSKYITSWNTPHQKIDSLKTYSNSLFKNENMETVFFPNIKEFYYFLEYKLT